MIIDHIGIVVKSLEEGIKNWERLFNYRQITEIVINSRQKVKVVFLEKSGSTTIKLIEPTDTTSPIYVLAKKGGGLHHLCFKCKNLDAGLNTLKENGARIILQPQPGAAFENENIAFVYGNQGLNIELIDTDKKANKLVKSD